MGIEKSGGTRLEYGLPILSNSNLGDFQNCIQYEQ
jgi:hypothetical protein